MKTFKLITQTIKKFGRKFQKEKTLESHPSANFKNGKKKSTNENSSSGWFNFICQIHPPVMFILTIVSLTGVVSYQFYNQPELAVGTIASTRIEAPADASFEDVKTTEELRRKTRTGLLPVLRENQNITDNIYLSLSKELNKIDRIRKLSSNFPFFNVGLVSTASQTYLRQSTESEWQEILAVLNNQSSLNSQSTPQQQKVIQELQKYRRKVTPREFNKLIEKIKQERNNYETLQSYLLKENIANLKYKEKQTLINISDEKWQETKKSIKTALNRILVQGIPPGLPEKLKKKTVFIQLGNSLSPETQAISVQILLDSLQPNLEINEEETKNRAERAAKAIKPVEVSIAKGQVIVDLGEEITQSQFVLLDGFGLSKRSINWMEVALSGVLVTSSVMIFLGIYKQTRHKLRRRDQFLLWLLSLTIPVIAIIDARYTSLPAVGFLISSFYGSTLAVTNVTLMTGLVLFQTGGLSWEYLVAAYAASILASLMASRLHSREDLALLGGGVGLIQGGVYLIINLILSATAGTIWYAVLPGAIMYGVIGVAYCVVALGISPYLERFFDLVTPIRLAELSNPNRPLLKRLAIEAPGTFQHTMFVASLAEAAARELHCNVELVRAGTLYHDIGKMHDPQGFIENQMGGPNKHDQIKNPFSSAEIIKKHVSEGLAMARKYGLPKAIRDFIPEHQGTLLISYFYFQAKNQAEEKGFKSFNEEDFRYDGPIPQSRETGIVMLADGCEAALRSLKDATPDQALAMIQKIFKARWRDHQLAECGLKYEELPIIAKIFVQVWQQYNHQRIAYPKAALEPQFTVKS